MVYNAVLTAGNFRLHGGDKVRLEDSIGVWTLLSPH